MSSNKLIFILILLALFLNHWILEPLIYLPDGQINILRIAIIQVIDIFCIVAAVILIIKNKARFGSPKKILFAGIMILLMLLFTEGMLQIAVRVSPAVNRILSPETATESIPHIVPDPLLGYRGNPGLPEHDSNGFRNKTALLKANIVAIGDSQVYGTSVKRDQAWPQQLGELSEQSVYNMSLGGYGSVQGLILMENEALPLSPKYIVYMMYDGNDAFDAYDAVYHRGLHDTLKLTDTATLKIPGDPEQRDAFDANVKEMTSRVWADESDPAKNSRMIFSKPKLYQLFSSFTLVVRTALTKEKDHAISKLTQQRDDANFVFYEDFSCNDFKTTFTPRYRMLGMNIQEPQIREGLRINLEAIREMKQLADSKSIHFLVVLLPTKERVFYELFEHSSVKPSASVQSTVELNDRIRERTMDYLRQYEIPFIDTLPVLNACFERGKQPFFQNADGHLNPAGHRAVALTVNDFIKNTLTQTNANPF